MAVFSTNQNRQLYVAKALLNSVNTLSNIGDLGYKVIDNKQLYFLTKTEGGLLRSDIIDLKDVTYAKYVPASEQSRTLKSVNIAFNTRVNDGNPIAGQDYIVRIYIHNYAAPANTQIKYGVVHATSSMSAMDFYLTLKESLTKNFSKEITPIFTFDASERGVTITEVEQPWNLGTKSSDPVLFDVVVVPVLLEGEEVDALTVTKQDSGRTIGNGKKIADLEYFCMGERGDQYRGLGYPNVIPTKYLVDPTKEYDTLEIHYSFSDTGVNSQKSEKQITIAMETGLYGQNSGGSQFKATIEEALGITG